MVKVANMTVPAGYQSLLDKLLAYFDNQIYPTWATRNFHVTRSAKTANKEKTYITPARVVWNAKDVAEKLLWKTAANFLQWSGYQYFISKYSYVKKHGLDLNIAPDATKQMYGLKVSNPGGLDYVSFQRDDIVLTGQVSVAFKYKKVERSATLDQPFLLYCEAYYFKDGQNLCDTYLWEAPSGNVGWTAVSFSFGTVTQYYFHLVCTWYLDVYDADVYLDNLLISDLNGDIYREGFKLNSKGVWVYTVHYRKQGWSFNPFYYVPYFEVVYLE